MAPVIGRALALLQVVAVAASGCLVGAPPAGAEEGSLPVEVVAQVGHSDAVEALAFSPDGTLAVSGDADGVVKIWSVGSERLLRTLHVPGQPVKSLAMLPDGRRLAAAFWQRAPIFDVATGKVLTERHAPEYGAFDDATLISGGAILLSRGAGGLQLEQTDLLGQGKAVEVDRVATESGAIGGASTGDAFVVVAGAELALWNGRPGRKARIVAREPSPISKAQTTGDGKTIAWAVGSTLRLASGGGEPVSRREHRAPISVIALSPDGTLAASGDETGRVVVWRLPEARAILTHQLPAKVTAAGFSASGDRLLLGDGSGGLRLTGTQSEGGVVVLSNPAPPTGALAPPAADGTVFHARGRAIYRFDPATGRTRQLTTLPADVTALSDAADGAVVAGTATGMIFALDGRSGSVRASAKPHRGFVTGLAVSGDGVVASGDENGEIALTSASSGRGTVRLRGLTDAVAALAFLPDGKSLIGVDAQCGVKRWLVAGGKAASRPGPTRPPAVCSGVTLAASLEFAVTGSDNNALGFVFDPLKTERTLGWSEIRTLENDDDVVATAISRDERWVATIPRSGRPRIWEARNGQRVATLEPMPGGIRNATFTRDGTRLFGLDGSGTLSVFDSRSGGLIVSARGDDRGHIVLTPEGFFDATPDAARALTIVRGLEVYSIDQLYQLLYRPDLVAEKLAGDPSGLVAKAAATTNLDAALASGPPPSLRFVDPPKVVAGDSVKLVAEASDRGGGIGKVEWRIGDVTVSPVTRALTRVDPGRGTALFEPTLTLSPGENRITLTVYNGADLVASRPLEITVTSTAREAEGPGRLLVLAVGVDDYFDSRLALKFAVSDARAVADGLAAAKGDLYRAVETVVVANSEVTPAGIESAVAAIAAKARPEDTFVLFVAGHGKTVDGRYYFLPRDFRYRDEQSVVTDGIGQQHFERWLSSIPARRSVLVFDTCESGILTGDRLAVRGLERVIAMEKLTAATGRTTIAAASDDKPALEGYREHGVFTYALLRGLEEADGNGDGRIGVLELIAYLDRAVPELSEKAFKYRQIPQSKFVGSSYALASRTRIIGDDGGDAAGPRTDRAPSHFVAAPTAVQSRPGAGDVVQRLEPGMAVSVVRSEGGWSLIIRQGRTIGFVEDSRLLRIR